MATPSDDSLTLVDSINPALYDVATTADGPRGSLPLTDEMLRDWPSGDLFGLSQNAGMGWDPSAMTGPQFLLLSTQGGVRADDGTPIALGYHTGHWEVGLLVQQAARDAQAGRRRAVRRLLLRSVRRPHAGHDRHVRQPALSQRRGDRVSPADSLAAHAARRAGRGHLRQGTAGHDAGAGRLRDLPCVLVPGGVTLPPAEGEDAGKVQSIGAATRTAKSRSKRRPRWAAAPAPRPAAAASFWARPPPSQVVAEASGMALPHAALAPSGQPIWLDMAHRSAWRLPPWPDRGIKLRDILTDAAMRNAMVVHAAFGGSTNLLLHVPAIAHAAGLRTPDGRRLARRQSPRAAVGRCAAQRAGRPSHGARCSWPAACRR